MLKHFLTFEKNIADLEGKIEELKHISSSSDLNIAEEIGRLQNKVLNELTDTYSNLNPWQKVQVARHPDRPQFQDVIDNLIDNYLSLGGDRLFGNDKALSGGIGYFRGKKVLLLFTKYSVVNKPHLKVIRGNMQLAAMKPVQFVMLA